MAEKKEETSDAMRILGYVLFWIVAAVVLYIEYNLLVNPSPDLSVPSKDWEGLNVNFLQLWIFKLVAVGVATFAVQEKYIYSSHGFRLALLFWTLYIVAALIAWTLWAANH
jgi:hypothetical protein